MATLSERAADKGKEFGTKVSEQMGNSIEGMRNAAGSVVEMVKDAGSNAFTTVEQRAGEAAGNLSSGLKATARSIRENGPQEGSLGCATSTIAQTFSNSANYLDNHSLKGTCSDISSLISRNPISAFLMGVGLGLLVGNTSKRR